MATTQGLFELLRKPERFDAKDLQWLRENLLGASSAFSNNANAVWLVSRIAVETIVSLAELDDSIRKLDASSTALIDTTNKLTTRILWLTGVGVVVSVVGVITSILLALHR